MPIDLNPAVKPNPANQPVPNPSFATQPVPHPAVPVPVPPKQTGPAPTQKDAMENLRRGIETLRTHQAAKVRGSLFSDALEYLETSFDQFKGFIK